MNTNSHRPQSRILKRLRLGLSYGLSLASVLAISAEAIANPLPEPITQLSTAKELTQTQTDQTQITPAQIAQASPEANSTASEAAALRLRPFFNLSHDEGGGFTGFTSVGGFFPLFQTPEQNVTFIDGRVSIDNEGNFGGGLQAGYRALLNDSTIWGAFAGLDASSTGDSSFTQANAGTELLGENWDLTFNANLPLGNTRQVVDTDIQAANPRFTGNQLLIDEQQVDQVQAALTTVSLDGGLELFDFGGGSSLWGRGGVYFLGGEASEDSLGFRASLDYRPKNNLRVGLGVQNDGIFDTNVVVSVNASLGSRTRRSYDTEEGYTEDWSRSQLWARAAEPINRTNTVLIENQTDVEVLQADVTAVNPETDQAFVFRHVDPSNIANDSANGAANGAENGVANAVLAEEIVREGTFEDPLSTIAEAADVADANADNIIFVQAGNAGGGFTLPDGVQVRSVGPVQQVNTQFGEVTLPGSGSGELPVVTGQVNIGSNTLVSGLEIDPAQGENGVATTEDGINGRGENIAIEDNVIANVGRGINLPDIDGSVSIVRNQISNTTSDGIFFDDIEGEDKATVTVADNTLETIGDEGIEFDLIEGSAIANITIANNQITNAEGDNIFIDDIQQNAVATIAISDNVIDGGNDGIEIDKIENNANATITVSNNQISNTEFEGIEFDDIENNAVANITVENNQINSNETGIEIDLIENQANATIAVVGNTITVADEEGILFDDIENDTITNITVENNNILSAATQGIEFDRIENNANATINVRDNQIANVGAEGIRFGEIDGTATAAITVDGNSITDTGDNGIEFNLIEENANVTATVINNTITNPGSIVETTPDPGDFPSIVVGGGNTDSDELDEDETELEAEFESSAVSSVVSSNATAATTETTTTEPNVNGVSITHTADTDMCLALDNNTVINPVSDGFELVSNGAGQFQVLELDNVTERNVGSFNPADIEANEAFVNGNAGEAPCP